MNIFFLDQRPDVCAQAHFDKHVVKMCIEYAQLLSTAHHVLGSDQSSSTLYKRCYENHPSAIWVRKSPEHYRWLYRLLKCLLDEYTYRYGKVHSTQRLLPLLEKLPWYKSHQAGWVDPPQCMPEVFQTDDTVQAYRAYYRLGKSRSMNNWRKRERPTWF
jgi:hypothetical protein